MKQQFAASIEIKAAPEVVFDLVTDVRRHTEFAGDKSITKKIYFDGELVPGARWVADEKLGPQKFQAPSEVVRVDRPREFTWVSFPPAKDEAHQGKVFWTYELVPSKVGTQLNHRMDLQPPPKGAWQIRLMRWLIRAHKKNPIAMQTSLSNIKRAAEALAASAPTQSVASNAGVGSNVR